MNDIYELNEKIKLLEDRLFAVLGHTETVFHDCPVCGKETVWQTYTEGDEYGCDDGMYCMVCHYNPDEKFLCNGCERDYKSEDLIEVCGSVYCENCVIKDIDIVLTN